MSDLIQLADYYVTALHKAFIYIFQGYWKNRPLQQYLRCLFIFISLLHVSPLAGHHQVEYTIIFGKLPQYNGSVLCYRSHPVYGLANTAVVSLICGNVKASKR
jgi:cbb3-type cytochrome oxidase subunit 1